MFDVVSLERKHIHALLKEPINNNTIVLFDDKYVDDIIAKTDSHALIVEDQILMCYGVSKLWSGRAHIWVLLSENIKKHPVIFWRSVKKLLEDSDYHRIEMDQPHGFEHGARRFKQFGFSLETEFAKNYYPNKTHGSIYVWVRE